jgi:hypothetical protein
VIDEMARDRGIGVSVPPTPVLTMSLMDRR